MGNAILGACKNSGPNSFPYPPLDSGESQTHPWLMLSQKHNSKTRRHTFYSISKRQCIERNIPEFHDKCIFLTSYGWLLLVGLQTEHCSLVNLATQEKIDLPVGAIYPSVCDSVCDSVTLSKPPNDPDCHIVVVFRDIILYCRLGDEKFALKENDGDRCLQVATNFKGKIYGWMGNGNIVTVDFVGRDLVLEPLMNDSKMHCCTPFRPPLFPYSISPFMVESCGELLLVLMVCTPYTWKQWCFRIFRVDIVDNKCEEVKGIGDCTIFLSPSGCMSLRCCAKDQVKKNSIYFSWKDDKYISVYDIEDRSKTLLRPCHMENGYPQFSFSPMWIMM